MRPTQRTNNADRPHPTWLTDKVDQSRRTAQSRTCPTCNADILTGPSDDPPYWTARVDPTPVDPITEVIALLGGRFSYDLIRGRLYTRADHHHHDPHRPHPVLLDHVCTPEVLF